jgi:putative pyruvate formate lyase activating enzyme
MAWLAGLSRDAYVDVMDQYRPAWKARTSQPEINRGARSAEIDEAVGHARRAGLCRLDHRWRPALVRVPC